MEKDRYSGQSHLEWVASQPRWRPIQAEKPLARVLIKRVASPSAMGGFGTRPLRMGFYPCRWYYFTKAQGGTTSLRLTRGWVLRIPEKMLAQKPPEASISHIRAKSVKHPATLERGRKCKITMFLHPKSSKPNQRRMHPPALQGLGQKWQPE